jgi:antirestriction protein ArdC
MSTAQLYQTVTAAIVAELEAGAAPWLKPWKTSPANGGYLPHNAVTGRAYRGINIPILWAKADRRGFPSHAWLTFKQAQEKGAHVRKGERGTEIVFTKKLRIKDQETEDEKQISMLKSFWVFNREQIEDLPDPSTDGLTEPTPDQKSAKVDSFIAATRADIRHGGSEAAFMPELDYIVMPPFAAFKTPEGYYATNLHELGHYSGHPSRLDRNLTGRFGTRAYAAEELVAELTSAFLCAHLGITGELRHAGYLAKWAELLKHDDRAIFTAAAKAQQAADFLRSFSEPEEETSHA